MKMSILVVFIIIIQNDFLTTLRGIVSVNFYLKQIHFNF